MFKSTLCDTLWVVYKVAWTASLNLDGLGYVLGNNIDRLLTERKGSTGEYWPEVVAVWTVIKLTWRMFVFFIHLWNLGKISIFQGSSGSFTVKNDNIHSFFFALLVANFEFAGFAPKRKYTGWTVSMETVRTAKSWPRKNQSEHKDLPKTGFAI